MYVVIHNNFHDIKKIMYDSIDSEIYKEIQHVPMVTRKKHIQHKL